MRTAQDWIDALGLEPLPGESGWWGPVSTSTASVDVGSRRLPAYNAIHYLLEPARPVNVWHWLEPDDTHVLVDGGPVEYVILPPGQPASRVVLGKDVGAGQTPTVTAPAGSWKALRLLDPDRFALMTTVVTPAWSEDRSAGNDATERPLFPAAFGPWTSGTPTILNPEPEAPPIVSVGALNPDGRTAALFSNQGPWVGRWAPGASVVSTMPAFNAGLEPAAATLEGGRLRRTIDPDDFSGGFAVWSGTSFAAPVVAGRLAAALADLPAPGAQEPSAIAVARARAALTEVPTIG